MTQTATIAGPMFKAPQAVPGFRSPQVLPLVVVMGVTAANYDVTLDGRFMRLGFNFRGVALRAVIGWTE